MPILLHFFDSVYETRVSIHYSTKLDYNTQNTAYQAKTGNIRPYKKYIFSYIFLLFRLSAAV